MRITSLRSCGILTWWRPLLSGVLSVCLVAAPLQPVLADSITDAAAQGQAAAAAAMPNAQNLIGQDANGNMLFSPGTANAVAIAPSQLMPGTGAVSTTTLSNASNNIGARAAAGGAAQQSLSTGSAPPNQAYQTVLDSFNRNTPDLTNDSVFNTTSGVLNNLSSNASLFGDCTTTTTYQTTTTTVHTPDYQECDRSYASTTNLTLSHSYDNGVIINPSGSVATSSCGDGCIDITLGQVGNNYLQTNGGCRIYEFSGSFQVAQSAVIESATIDYALWDDRMQVLLNNSIVWQSDSTAFPPENDPSVPIYGTGQHSGQIVGYQLVPCDLGKSWISGSPNWPAIAVDVSNILTPGATVPFEIRISVGGDGEGYAMIRVRYNASDLNYDTWTPPADVNTAVSIAQQGGNCQSTFTCQAMPQLDSDGCAIMPVGRVCPSFLTSATDQALSAYVNPLCTQVQVTESCSVTAGQMECYTDFQGHQQCYTNPGTNSNNCASLQQNPACSYVTTQCIDTDANTGACLVDVDTYDCGTDLQAPGTTTATQAVACVGPIRCMGTECTSTTQESNSGFAQVAATLQAVEATSGDGNCADPTDPTTCQIFAGTADKCKVAVGGYVNCCQHAVSVNLSDYLNMVFSLKSVNSAIEKLSTDSPVRGAWEMITSPLDPVQSLADQTGALVDSAWSDAQAAFTSSANSLFESIAPNAGEIFSTGQFADGMPLGAIDGTASGVSSGIIATMTNNVAQWTANTFGDAAANLIFSQAPSVGIPGGAAAFGPEGIADGGVQFGGGAAFIGTAITWIGAAYAVYSIVTTLIQIIYACEEDEYKLDTYRQLKECHYIGSYCDQNVLGLCIERRESYCCFDTPLARIIQEQARPQLGLDFGSPKNPQCQGLTVGQFSQVNWSQVDLSEWTGMLYSSGLIPAAGSITPDSLTGSGNALATGTARTDAITRSISRLQGIDLSGTMSAAQQQLQGQTGPLP